MIGHLPNNFLTTHCYVIIYFFFGCVKTYTTMVSYFSLEPGCWSSLFADLASTWGGYGCYIYCIKVLLVVSQLSRDKIIFFPFRSPSAPDNMWSRESGFGCLVPRQRPIILHILQRSKKNLNASKSSEHASQKGGGNAFKENCEGM